MIYPNGRVIQFAKLPLAGRVKTRMIPALGAQGALRLHCRLVEQVWQDLSQAQVCPVELWWSEQPGTDSLKQLASPLNDTQAFWQSPGDLGARMDHAFTSRLVQHEFVLLVGSDCPVLDAAYLEEAARRLMVLRLQNQPGVVLGPAEDGGYVLIGLWQPPGQLLLDIEWGTPGVYKQTAQRAQAMGWRVENLAERWDVDRPEDYQRLLSTKPEFESVLG